jgi:hypothetical protein
MKHRQDENKLAAISIYTEFNVTALANAGKTSQIVRALDGAHAVAEHAGVKDWQISTLKDNPDHAWTLIGYLGGVKEATTALKVGLQKPKSPQECAPFKAAL